MKDRPILFKPHMVRAILEGRKTQTRRVVKEQGIADALPEPWLKRMCPYGEVGDRLWVREAWSISGKKFRPGGPVVYRESGKEPLGGRWRPSIHMPRAASRLMLEITEVRIQRLDDITEEDAYAEGADTGYVGPGMHTRRMGFFNLWESINGIESLDANPWVWAVTFKIAQ